MESEAISSGVGNIMFEVRIIRSDHRYDVIVNNEQIIYAIRSNSYFSQKFNFFNSSNSTAIATYLESKSFFLPSKRSIFFLEQSIHYQISRRKACYFLEVPDLSYSLCYGLATLKGFFLNDIKVGKVEILRSTVLSYEKKIVFFENIENYLPFIYLFIPIDDNEF